MSFGNSCFRTDCATLFMASGYKFNLFHLGSLEERKERQRKKTAGLIRCDYLVVSHCYIVYHIISPFTTIFFCILLSFLNCPLFFRRHQIIGNDVFCRTKLTRDGRTDGQTTERRSTDERADGRTSAGRTRPLLQLRSHS